MTGQEIRDEFRRGRIAHHYFYKGAMARYPLLKFDKEYYPENYAKLEAVIAYENKMGRLHEWYNGTPEPFPHLVEVLFDTTIH